jgi:hypothetical protein
VPTFVTIAAFTNPLEAHIAKGRLEAEDIQAFIVNELQIWNQWYLSDALGGVRIQVFAEDEVRARAVIGSHMSGKYESEIETNAAPDKHLCCTRCDSENISSRFSYTLVLLMIFTLGLCGIIFPLRKDIHKCTRCHHQWKY